MSAIWQATLDRALCCSGGVGLGSFRPVRAVALCFAVEAKCIEGRRRFQTADSPAGRTRREGSGYTC